MIRGSIEMPDFVARLRTVRSPYAQAPTRQRTKVELNVKGDSYRSGFQVLIFLPVSTRTSATNAAALITNA